MGVIFSRKMSMIDPEIIKDIASKVRQFFEDERYSLPEIFSEFPFGCCGNASDLLGCLLVEMFGTSADNDEATEVHYIHGTHPDDGSTHAWIEVDGKIVDITCDQYPEAVDPVFVGISSEFYDSFEHVERRPPEVPIDQADLVVAFQRLKKWF